MLEFKKKQTTSLRIKIPRVDAGLIDVKQENYNLRREVGRSWQDCDGLFSNGSTTFPHL